MPPYLTTKNIAKKTKRWLKEIEPYNVHQYKLAEKSALMVIDMQKYFIKPGAGTYHASGAAIIGNVKKLIGKFREVKRPVIFTHHVHKPDFSDAGIMQWWWDDMCIEGSEDAEIYDELSPLPDEKIISKHRYDAFYNTDLETILRVQKIEDIVITGVMTNLCCESTARGAYYRDYRVHFTADATGTVSEEMHRASLLNLSFGFARITTTETIIKELDIRS
ncbi:MAG: cysteine hydrolase [candidate division Zixibacteria bacterium]|nr:cysteine hydrolase [candidate division Zixibacteria bacterium]